MKNENSEKKFQKSPVVQELYGKKIGHSVVKYHFPAFWREQFSKFFSEGSSHSGALWCHRF